MAAFHSRTSVRNRSRSFASYAPLIRGSSTRPRLVSAWRATSTRSWRYASVVRSAGATRSSSASARSTVAASYREKAGLQRAVLVAVRLGRAVKRPSCGSLHVPDAMPYGPRRSSSQAAAACGSAPP